MSEESITLQSTADNIFDPKIILNYCKGKTRFEGICLKQGSVSFIHGNVINLDISYELDTRSRDLNKDFKWGNCLFGAMKLTTNTNLDKYRDILVMVLDLIHVDNYCGQTVTGVKTLLLLVLTWAVLSLLIIKRKVY